MRETRAEKALVTRENKEKKAASVEDSVEFHATLRYPSASRGNLRKSQRTCFRIARTPRNKQEQLGRSNSRIIDQQSYLAMRERGGASQC